MPCCYITHPSSLLHEMGPEHPDSPQRLSVIHDYLLSHGLLDFMEVHAAPAATRAQVERVHDASHVERLIGLAPDSGYARVDPDTFMNRHTLDAAFHAAGAAVLAAELVASGRAAAAFCNVRPAGHHATRNAAMGFCFFNNVAVGIAHAFSRFELRRIALVDFDAHHGNGSADIFAGDARVLMLSAFERGLYPFNADESGAAEGRSIALDPYSKGDALRAAVTAHWLPALNAFEPEMIFMSAGFDAHREDDMTRLCWTDSDYAWITHELVALAERCAHGRIVSVLEGGYCLTALARSAGAHVRALIGAD